MRTRRKELNEKTIAAIAAITFGYISSRFGTHEYMASSGILRIRAAAGADADRPFLECECRSQRKPANTMKEIVRVVTIAIVSQPSRRRSKRQVAITNVASASAAMRTAPPVPRNVPAVPASPIAVAGHSHSDDSHTGPGPRDERNLPTVCPDPSLLSVCGTFRYFHPDFADKRTTLV
jgi:hypothetical protein